MVLVTALLYEYLFQNRNPCFALIGLWGGERAHYTPYEESEA